MLEARAICETCGHTRDWHDREAVRARLRAVMPIERPCYREIRGSPCPCGGFKDSGTLVVPAGALSMPAPPAGFAIVRVAVLALLLVIMGLGLLYAYRSQTPSVPEVDLSQALQDINAGRVQRITVVGSAATLEFRDSPSHQERTAVPQPDNVLSPAVSAYNAAHPSQPIELRFMPDNQTFVVLGSIVLSLLPIVLIGGFFYYVMRAARRRS